MDLTEVEGKRKCDMPDGVCYLWESSDACKQRCINFVTARGDTFYDGVCIPRARISIVRDCYCCFRTSRRIGTVVKKEIM